MGAHTSLQNNHPFIENKLCETDEILNDDMSDSETELDEQFHFDKDRFVKILEELVRPDPKLVDVELSILGASLKYLTEKFEQASDQHLESVRQRFPQNNTANRESPEDYYDATDREQEETRRADETLIETEDVESINERMNNLEVVSNATGESAEDESSTNNDLSAFYDTDAETRCADDYETESNLTRSSNPPNEPHVDFASFVDETNCYLSIKKKFLGIEQDIRREQIRYPLGVIYDEFIGAWFSCEMECNKIMRFTINGDDSAVSVIEHELITNPSAVTLYREGRSIAILTSVAGRRGYSIYIYDHLSKTIKCFANHRDEQYAMTYPLRGLAKSIGKNLISIESRDHMGKLRVFRKNVGGLSFDIPNAKNASFIASREDQVAVSDLGNNNVYLMHLDDTDWDKPCFSVLRVLKPESSIPQPICNTANFMYVAGLQFDVNGNLLIGDARGRTIKLFSNELEFLHRVSSDFAIPYMSSFWVNKDGEMLIVDIHGSIDKFVYAQVGSQSEVSPFIEPSDAGRSNGGPRRGNGNSRGARSGRHN